MLFKFQKTSISIWPPKTMFNALKIQCPSHLQCKCNWNDSNNHRDMIEIHSNCICFAIKWKFVWFFLYSFPLVKSFKWFAWYNIGSSRLMIFIQLLSAILMYQTSHRLATDAVCVPVHIKYSAGILFRTYSLHCK